MHRIGIVGCGGIAKVHIDGYRAVAGGLGEVVAGADPDADRLASFCDLHDIGERFTDPVALVESGKVDVIALLTPPAVRREVIIPAIDRGVHVLVEKPFGESVGDAESYVAAAEKAGVTLAVNQQLRFMPDVLAAKEIIDSGDLGEVRFIAHDHFQNRTRTSGWRSREKRLEISIFSIHILDRIRWLMGEKVRAVTATTRSLDSNVAGETFTAMTIQFENGRVGTMVSSWHSPGVPECRLRIDGTGGSLVSAKKAVLDDDAVLTVQRGDAAPERREFNLKNAFSAGMGESMKRLLEAVDTGKPPVNSGRDNLETMRIVDAAYLSASREGERVEAHG